MMTREMQAFGIVRVGEILIGIPISQLSEVCHVHATTDLPVPSKALLGAFELRGSAVPLLNIARILGMDPKPLTAYLAVVLKHEDAVLGFYVDEVMGIANCSTEDVQPLSSGNTTEGIGMRGVFRHADGFVSVLDVPSIFELPDVFSAKRPGFAKKGSKSERHTRQLTFQAGGALYAVPAIEVYAAVPRQQIKVTAITAGPCLGEIFYYNRRVPVMCPVSVLGLGNIGERGPSEIVVIRFPNDQLLGFAVDAIHNIESFAPERSADVPLWRGQEEKLISRVQIKESGEQVYAIDIDRLHTHPIATNFASLSQQSADTEIPGKVTGEEIIEGNVIRERERYLVVDVGAQVAIPLDQVNCITDPPSDITPAQSGDTGFRGYFSRFGKSVALFELADMLCMPPERQSDQPEHRRVVLTGTDQKQVGFEVSQVLSIEVSEWREPAKKGEHGPTVQLGKKANRIVLPIVEPQLLMRDGPTPQQNEVSFAQ